MKIVLAFDSFKECMSSFDAIEVIKQCLSHQCIGIPLSDGGEGTMDVLSSALNGKIIKTKVLSVFLNELECEFTIINDCAVIESAKVCGLQLTDGLKNPHLTSTYGLGQLILKALDYNVSRIIITLGGSATNDGGIGMLNALGVRFYNKNSSPLMMMDGLKDINTIDISGIDQRLKNTEIIGLCDVDNPLCGDKGATYVYGPQKGLKEEELSIIDEAMNNYAIKTKEVLNSNEYDSGCGAAGGLGFALKYYLNASLCKGFETISAMLNLEEYIKKCDCVFTGEGQIDASTQFGKVPYGVLKLAKKYNKKVYVFAGRIKDHHVLYSLGFDRLYEISAGIELNDALIHGKDYLKKKVLDTIKEIEEDVQS